MLINNTDLDSLSALGLQTVTFEGTRPVFAITEEQNAKLYTFLTTVVGINFDGAGVDPVELARLSRIYKRKSGYELADVVVTFLSNGYASEANRFSFDISDNYANYVLSNTLISGGDIYIATDNKIYVLREYENTYRYLTGFVDNGNVIKCLYLNGNDLYVGGTFTVNDNGLVLNNIAKFNVSTGVWTALGNGTGAAAGVNGTVNTIGMHGTDLFIGGHFEFDNGISPVRLNHVAKFNAGTNRWNALGNGVGYDGAANDSTAIVYTLAFTHDGGMCVGGKFDHIGNGIACPAFGVYDVVLSAGWYKHDVTHIMSPGDIVRSIQVTKTNEYDATADVYLCGTFTINGHTNTVKWEGSTSTYNTLAVTGTMPLADATKLSIIPTFMTIPVAAFVGYSPTNAHIERYTFVDNAGHASRQLPECTIDIQALNVYGRDAALSQVYTIDETFGAGLILVFRNSLYQFNEFSPSVADQSVMFRLDRKLIYNTTGNEFVYTVHPLPPLPVGERVNVILNNPAVME